ncbi:MAG TPA: glycosyl hydrolase family 18 protein [Bryobacteraceae bacterium]|nr:glycosyl hydrolase family 18 protein [Bryobacteraceae bacterium]
MRRFLLFSVIMTSALTARPKALFYLTDSPASVRSFLAHASKVDILVPTWYSVDAAGLVSGGPNPLVMETAKAHHVPVMPIIVNPGFNQDNFHKLLGNPDGKRHMIDALVSECKKHGYLGFQYDFENILWTDGGALTQLVSETAVRLHREGLQLSIATVPNAPGFPGKGAFARWIFANWRGAYDLKALAESVDLICLMTYDEHTRYTPPGPVAGYPWTLENLEYALKVVPKEKLSLGIPLYGYRWFAGDPGKEEKPSIAAASIGGEDVRQLIDTFHPQMEWDAGDKTAWFYFYRDAMREWVFYTDKRAFEERLKLVTDRGIQGFCSWVLGQEDPAIWDALAAESH